MDNLEKLKNFYKFTITMKSMLLILFMLISWVSGAQHPRTMVHRLDSVYVLTTDEDSLYCSCQTIYWAKSFKEDTLAFLFNNKTWYFEKKDIVINGNYYKVYKETHSKEFYDIQFFFDYGILISLANVEFGTRTYLISNDDICKHRPNEKFKQKILRRVNIIKSSLEKHEGL